MMMMMQNNCNASSDIYEQQQEQQQRQQQKQNNKSNSIGGMNCKRSGGNYYKNANKTTSYYYYYSSSSLIYYNYCLLLLVLIIIFCIESCNGQQQQDPTTLNGGSVLAMAGKECIAVAVDKRFGSGMQMVNISPRHILTPHSQVLVAFTGLEGDIQSLSQDISTEVTSKKNRGSLFGTTTTIRIDDNDNEQQQQQKQINTSSSSISPRAMASLTSHILYNRRQSPYYVEPLVVGLSSSSSSSSKPFLCAMDMIGAKSYSKSFICGGVASKSLYGTAEALWEPNLNKERLIKICSKAFLSALERDCLSGYGAIIYLVTPNDGIIEYDLLSRND